MRYLTFLIFIALVSCKERSVRTLPIIGPIDFDMEEDTIYHQIRPFHLTNQLGQEINQDSLKGKIHVAEFFFSSCPVICPIMKKRMDMVVDVYSAKQDFRVVSFTVDPKKDTVEHLQAYGEKLNIDPKTWFLLTGDADEIQRVSYYSYIQANVRDSLSLNHSQQFVLVDKNLHIRGLYDGTDSTSVSTLIEDIELLYKEENDRD